MATSFGALAQPFGAIVALALGPIFVNKNKCEKEDVEHYMMVLAITNSSICLLMLLFFRERPKLYPSRSALYLKSTVFNFKDDLITLANNRNFLLLNVPFIMSYSVHHTMSAVLSSILTPYGYDEK